MRDYIDSWLFSFRGMEFRAYMLNDDTERYPPWKEYDGHGIISEWEHRDKRPGERIIAEDRGSRMFYDVRETMRKAMSEGWSIGPERIAEWAKRIGKQPTKRQIAAAAVETDYKRMRGLIDSEWYYVGICVCQIDDEGEDISDPYENALWGIESDSGQDYFQEVANDCASEVCASAENKQHRALRAMKDTLSEFQKDREDSERELHAIADATFFEESDKAFVISRAEQRIKECDRDLSAIAKTIAGIESEIRKLEGKE